MKELGYLLMKASRNLRYSLAIQLEKFDITPSQWAVMKELERRKTKEVQARTAAAIGDALGFDKPTMSGIVKRLLQKGLLRKDAHPTDRRAFLLSLTDEGKNLIPSLEAESEFVLNQAVITFSNEDKQQLLRYLIEMNDVLEK